MNWQIELITIFVLFIIATVWEIITGFIVVKKEIEGKKLLILLVLPLLFLIFGIWIMNIIEIILCFIS
ncbi:hypothetical protein M1771_09865 [Spiroplasma citri]|uniref:Plectrovirus-related protein n=1 Tax=Spiroplasma citri TaxID=2133 RepID=A0AAX3SYR7_SPICI|nr:hypothetical protein [Spiroplasma citri]WFG96364.1 hypothetical protein M0C40_09885 [Spiroplasma citri]WFH00258.1 hypothetical protein M1771_09865 [Spiroplasma citri]